MAKEEASRGSPTPTPPEVESEQFIVTAKDIQNLVDIVTDGTTPIFSKTIDWIAEIRKHPLAEHILNGGDRCGAIPPTAKAVGFLAPRS